MSSRLIIKEIIPESYQTFMQLAQLLANAGINKLQHELIKIRASQINGCAFCLDIHTREAIKYGEDPRRLYVLSAWREAKEWFSKQDQVVLNLTEEITLIADGGLSDETYNESVTVFGEEMTAKLITAVISINALNRLGVSQKLHPLSNP
ncbi:MAG TPA: carboxymuconolactone decarboxylase family protein [Pedobacter sp.]|nr:carboxymuconolactone decarboxylase family protein [Pedobacter sp.]